MVSTPSRLPVKAALATPAMEVVSGNAPATIAGSAPGTAGSASANVLTIQGVTSMTPVQVSQATAANLNATVSQAGTWTVQPGNTQNTTPWLVAPAASQARGQKRLRKRKGMQERARLAARDAAARRARELPELPQKAKARRGMARTMAARRRGRTRAL